MKETESIIKTIGMEPYEIWVRVQPYFGGNYRLEYDGKYITLFGEDKDYPGFKFTEDQEDWYEEMVLISCVMEIRKASPKIIYSDDKVIKIQLHS